MLGCYMLGGSEWLLWGFAVPTVCVWHATFAVNSVCHLWGNRRFATTDNSRNNGLVALLTFGEGWHNNHHTFPWSARHGLQWWEVDMTYLTLRTFEQLGIVWDLRVPTEAQIKRVEQKSSDPAFRERVRLKQQLAQKPLL